MERRVAVARDHHHNGITATARAREGLDALDIHPDVLFTLDLTDRPELA